MAENETLDKALIVARNLMKIELDRKYGEKQKEYDDIIDSDELRIINSKKISMEGSYAGDVIGREKWLQDLLTATQDAVFHLNNLDYKFTDEDDLGYDSTKLISDDGLIINSDVVNFISMSYNSGHVVCSVGLNGSIVPWLEDRAWTYKDFELLPEDKQILIDWHEIRVRLEKLQDEKREISNQRENMDETLLHVETELLISQLKSSDDGQDAVNCVSELVKKHLGQKALPTGTSYLN